jgi:hypothetical protein
VKPDWLKLADIGIHGNGHMMMLEKQRRNCRCDVPLAGEKRSVIMTRYRLPAGRL